MKWTLFGTNKEDASVKEVDIGTVYFTVSGTYHYYGHQFLKPGDKVKLIKEPDNEYDREAIRVEYEGLGKIGYVANSPYTVKGESVSAGRLYDLFRKKAKGKVVLTLRDGVLCKLVSEKKPAEMDDQGEDAYTEQASEPENYGY